MPEASLKGLASVLLLLLFVTCLHDASQAWDVAYYHLPFAGRLVGLLPSSEYVFSRANQARFDGFPLLAELAQGLLWRVTRRPESANLVAFASLLGLAAFASWRLRVPPHLAVVSLLAIPLVQTHATSAYVDLPGNAAVTVLVLLVIHAFAEEGPVDARTLGGAVLAAFIAANVKPLLHPIVASALLALGVRGAQTCPPRARRWLLAVLSLSLPFVFATAVKNTVMFSNPYYPVKLTILGHALPGVEDPYSSSPLWLEAWPRPVRFVCSLLEIGLPPYSDPRRWTVDQWRPPDDPGYRMGGFFGLYVLAQLVVLGWRIARDRSRSVRVAAIGFCVLSAIVSVLPQSHELRYYMCWMLALVLVNAWLAARPEAVASAPGLPSLTVVATVALGVVLAVTRAAYAYPSGSSYEELVRAKVDSRVVAAIDEDERVCVDDEPFDLLWAPLFHPPRRYVEKEAESDVECQGLRIVR